MSDQVGKTLGDIAGQILCSRALLAGLVASGLAIFTAVHLAAKPGTEVSLFCGLAKYQKSESAIVVAPQAPAPAETTGYVLPQKARTHDYGSYARPSQPVTYAILDQSVNFSCDDKVVILGGAQVKRLSVAARTKEGDPLTTTTHPISGAIWINLRSMVSHVELLYKANYFAIQLFRYRGVPNR
jgi:hypothetical protein